MPAKAASVRRLYQALTNNVPSKAMQKLKPVQLKKDQEQGYTKILNPSDYFPTLKHRSWAPVRAASVRRLYQAPTNNVPSKAMQKLKPRSAARLYKNLNPSDCFPTLKHRSWAPVRAASVRRLYQAPTNNVPSKAMQKLKPLQLKKIRSKAIQNFKPFRLFSHSKTQIMGACQSRLGEASISGTNNVPSKAMQKLKPFQLKKDREQGYVTI